jgi:transcriptional regulator with XRE-family HTH domain
MIRDDSGGFLQSQGRILSSVWHNPSMTDRDAPGGVHAARLRAALAYGRLSDAEAADALGVSVTQLSRLKRGAAMCNPVQRRVLAQRTGVPWWFLEHGFAPPVDIREQDALNRIAALEEHVEADRDLRAELVAELTAIAAEGVSPSVAGRAREASRRLAGTQPTSRGTDDAEGGAGAGR